MITVTKSAQASAVSRRFPNSTFFFWGGLALVSSVAFGLYLRTLSYGFLSDDYFLVKDHHFNAPTFLDSLAYFGREWGMGLGWNFYRPLVRVFWWVEWAIFGENSGGWHFVSVLLHMANAALVYLLVWQLTRQSATATLAGLFFSLHPLHVEPVSWIADQSDLLVGVFCPAALSLYIHSRQATTARPWLYYALSLGCFGLGLFSKESALGFALAPLAYELIFSPWQRKGRFWLGLVARQVPFWLVFGLYWPLRLFALRSVGGSASTRWTFNLGTFFDTYRDWLLQPLSLERTLVRLFLGFLVIVLVVGLVLYERGDSRTTATNPALSFRFSRTALLGLVWTGLFLIPNVPIKPYSRYTYISSIGVAILAAVLLGPLFKFGSNREANGQKGFLQRLNWIYISLPATGIKLVVAASLGWLAFAQVRSVQRDWSQTDEFNRAILAQLQEQIPEINNYSVVYLAGLLEAQPGKRNAPFEVGFIESVQLRYTNPTIQAIPVSGFAVVEQRLNQTHFAEYRDGRLVQRDDLVRNLQARNVSIKDKKEIPALTWTFGRAEDAQGWLWLNEAARPGPGGKSLQIEAPQGGILRSPAFIVPAPVLAKFELKLRAQPLPNGPPTAQLVLHWLVETPGGLVERASAPLVVATDGRTAVYSLKPPDMSAFLYNDTVREIRLEVPPGLAHLEIESAQLFRLP